MPIMRPEKLPIAGAPVALSRSTPAKEPKPGRTVWDDFGEQKRSKKRREYEKGEGNRMVLKPSRHSLVFASDLNKTDEERAAEEAEAQTFPQVDYSPLESRLGYTFTDRELLTRALTHRSALGLRERTDYERLEFLGDAVLDLSIAHLLCEKYPEAKEGELSKMRAALVNTQALAQVAKELELGPFIRLGRGEATSGGQERPSILADVTEAVFGAMYQDSDYERAFQCVQQIFGPSLEQVQPSDPKTELQEALHAAGSELPSYLLELVEGPEHAPLFVTVVVVDNEIAGRGKGATKKGAQQAAAAEALHKLAASHRPFEMLEGHEYFIERALLVTVPPALQTTSGAVPQPVGGEMQQVQAL